MFEDTKNISVCGSYRYDLVFCAFLVSEGNFGFACESGLHVIQCNATFSFSLFDLISDSIYCKVIWGLPKASSNVGKQQALKTMEWNKLLLA